ncbi:MAG TPA: hypothetical protein PK827_12925 [Accumulibacter sp.]|uniref:hypothetical protein n=1 Tax=Accumulibacter sp. TaxID=2053492 RepID=UPI002BD64D5A|nr:hypothetical protein [Accumulibacter sp.]HNJ51527.1 hypothetical protein [Accumulibacter sp.]
MSLTLFLFVSLFVSLAVARSFGATAQAKAVRAGEGAATAALSQLSASDYSLLDAGTFVAPDACPGSGNGAAATTCARSGSAAITISYKYVDASGNCTASNGSGTRGQAYVGVCATVDSINGAAPPGAAQTAVRYINAPSAAWSGGGKSVVRVAVTSNSSVDFSSTSLKLVKRSDPSSLVAFGTVKPGSSTAYLSVLNPADCSGVRQKIGAR